MKNPSIYLILAFAIVALSIGSVVAFIVSSDSTRGDARDDKRGSVGFDKEGDGEMIDSNSDSANAGEESEPRPTDNIGEVDGEEAITPSQYSIKTEPENLSGAPNSLKLGFNNSEQVVDSGSGTNMVWVSDGKLSFVSRSKEGVVTSTKTIATSANLMLPAITRSGDLVAIGWVEKSGRSDVVKAVVSTDGGANFGSIATLGNGSGVALATDSGNLVATWHDGSEETSAKIWLRSYAQGAWEEAVRVDQSTAAPLWASVAIYNKNVFVTWRDNRDNDQYSVWLRRSLDLGKTWETEQHIGASISGDPDICFSSDSDVWIAHHGRQTISLLHSKDGGETFGSPQAIGKGVFAHLSCTQEVVAIAWEYTLSGPKATDKKAGWALLDSTGKIIGTDAIDDGDVSATTIYLSPDNTWAEVIWVNPEEGNPLNGALRHQIMSLK